MLALKKRTMILGIAVFLIVWAILSGAGQVVGANDASGTLPPPTLVSPANDTWVKENMPTFTWTFINQSGFNLQISNGTNFVTLFQNITEKSSIQNYTLTTALIDGMYYWRVRANNTSGIWSIWSEVWIVKIDTVPPSLSDNAPVGWQLTKPIIVTLNATDTESGVSKVYYKEWAVGTSEPVNYTEGTSIVLNADGKWIINYKAVDVAGNSANKTKEVWIDTTNPSPVTGLSARKWTRVKIGSGGTPKELKLAGGEFVEINWTQSGDPYFMQYEIYVSTNQSALERAIAMQACNATIASVGSTSYAYPSGLEGLDSGKTYYFAVVVVDQAGRSSESAIVTVTTIARMNWPLMGGIALAVELVIGAIFLVFKLFIKKK
jgi:hypothetical protein